MPRERDTLKLIFNLIKQSLNKKVNLGNFVGEDKFGNKYFEIPADPRGGKRKPVRWFENPTEEVNEPLPVEWNSWISLTRQNPPTEEEIIRNAAIIQMKKENAIKLEEKYKDKDDMPQLPVASDSDKVPFPKYEEYERFPGQKFFKKEKE